MRDAAIRAVRTFFQTAIGVWLAGVVGDATDSLDALANLELLEAAAAAGIVALVTFVHNALEESTPVPTLKG